MLGKEELLVADIQNVFGFRKRFRRDGAFLGKGGKFLFQTSDLFRQMGDLVLVNSHQAAVLFTADF